MVVIEETAEQNPETTAKRVTRRRSSSAASLFDREPINEPENLLRTKDNLEEMKQLSAKVSDAEEITKALSKKLEMLAQDIDRKIKKEKQKIGRAFNALNRGAKSSEPTAKPAPTSRGEVKTQLPRNRAPDMLLLRHQPGLISQLNRS